MSGTTLDPEILALFNELLAEGRLEELEYIAHPEKSGPILTGA